MHGAYHKGIALYVLVTIMTGSFVVVRGAETPPEIKTAIEKKRQEEQELGNQIKAVQGALETTAGEKQTLQRELTQINSNVKQLDLGIRYSKTAAEKLGYEIQDTQYTIEESEERIEIRKKDIAEMLRQVQQKDYSEGPLMSILKGKSLTDAVGEIQALIEFQENFSQEIRELQGYTVELDQHLKTAEEKKHQKEVETENFKNKKVILDQTKQYQQQLLAQTKNKEQIYQNSLTELKKKQDQIDIEIARLESEARKDINISALPKVDTGPLMMPAQGRLTQGYGATPFALRSYASKRHNGIDIAAPIGTPIYAASDGRVVGVADQDLYCRKGAYGKFVAITHYNGLTTLYAHLSLWKVSEGQEVKKGDVIGYMGSTGFSTGSHLHFTVYATPTFKIAPAAKSCGPKMPFGGDLNPFDYLAK
ncbi:MAG: Peptidase, M23/M37 family [Candidatus Wolfebacteria bacterium GW2011_GWE1_48_7]|uniref:Peptidase, M23/M37 family n=2 Tax=Candidatus Wolfeibacteriota TaxID=1752735 RepID=A0A0G1U7I0_9BACT|nr:MAG: M24/M37 family peptidase [Candidatus Wolfebacteria bacterium GW2011_GWB1_47_1]KKU37106.1 MAG: Peptidase, M23/M37 family [Candidatus Wolfebacteria bacterium GW2011_GWC2_46_275]KKU42403.1 MAG: Peptidase, M23/M37 family [Candidatus Wolfebacteria bacterium GW2011_GWB2_46_69]KKU54370.1 MAG: Peptidase, M23/M37 family [Candidatus Wolfebacteria bacterium GW2011_GWC1_47_103]KKU59505.1 MAG: Peptidase, M23/M37 family [Candidatus Wolfebacteria bacterium GW2011_GWE2_47_12]KKU66200.1 MAG: Peptidase,